MLTEYLTWHSAGSQAQLQMKSHCSCVSAASVNMQPFNFWGDPQVAIKLSTVG